VLNMYVRTIEERSGIFEEKKEVMDVIYGLIFLRDDINKFIL